MKIVNYVLFILLIFSACNNEEKVAIYTYRDMSVTRFDKSDRTTFTFSNTKTKNAGKIWVNYSGVDSYFEAILMFDKKKHQVTILACDAYLESEGLDTTFFKTGRYNYEDEKVNPFGIVNHNINNTAFYQIKLPYKGEQNLERNLKTKVKAIYWK